MSPHTFPLDFNHIPHRDGLFVHFDAASGTYLVQAFFKAETLEFIFGLSNGPGPQDDISIDVKRNHFDDARDSFLKKLIDADVHKKEIHTR